MIESSRRDMDEAIDRVAATLVAAPGGDRMLQNVIARLPARSPTPWFLTRPVQLTAGAAMVLVALVFSRQSREAASPESLPVAAPAIAEVSMPETHARSAAGPLPGPRFLVGALRSPLPAPRSPIDRPDHERSLAPLEPLTSLEVPSMAPDALEPATSGVLAPLVLTELPLAGEFSSPRER